MAVSMIVVKALVQSCSPGFGPCGSSDCSGISYNGSGDDDSGGSVDDGDSSGTDVTTVFVGEGGCDSCAVVVRVLAIMAALMVICGWLG